MSQPKEILLCIYITPLLANCFRPEQAAEASPPSRGGCSLWWNSVMDTYGNSRPWIPLGRASNMRALGRGEFTRYARRSQRYVCVCVSYCAATGAGL